jgi:geranylgeranyl diphosphate synthase type II
MNISDFNPEEKISAVLNIYNQLNIKKLTEQKIESYFQKCGDIFQQIPVEQQRKKRLLQISTSMLNRVY